MAAQNALTFSKTQGYALTALSSRNPETGPALARKHRVDFVSEWQALIQREDIDSIAICSNNESHGQMVLAGLEMGKHIFCEYPIARDLDELAEIKKQLATCKGVVRVSHNEPLSPLHQTLKTQAKEMGNLLSAFFTRFTPGRGTRPHALFNIPLSGPPSLFFVYHIYPLVDIFGPVAWVKAGAEYEGLQPDGQYQRFVNCVTAGFKNGGLSQWNWAGGIEIEKAEEYRHILMTQGTLLHTDNGWQISTPQGSQKLNPLGPSKISLAEQFLEDINGDTLWRADTQVAIDAATVGLAAEKSVNEKRRVQID